MPIFLIISLIFALVIIAGSLAMIVVIINVIALLIIRIPSVMTPKDYYQGIFSNLKINADSVIYDLGCGNGDFLVAASKYGSKKCLGYELSPIFYLQAVINTFIGAKAPTFVYWKDFFRINIGEADIVFIYLVKTILDKVSDKLHRELNQGAQIVCIGSPLPGWKLNKKIILNKKNNYNAYLYLK